MKKNLYESQTAFIPAETARLQNFNFPFYTSTQLLLNNFNSVTNLIDIGAGSSPMLAEWIIENGGKYTAIDIQMKFLKNLKQLAAAKYRAAIKIKKVNLRALEITPNSFDTSHTRFVLSHIAEKKERISVIQKILKLAPQAVFLDHDWSTIRATGIAESFRIAAVEFFKHSEYNPNYGKLLYEELKEISPNAAINQVSFSREEGFYYSEILMHSRSLLQVPKIQTMPNVLALMNDVTQTLEACKNDFTNLPKFTPPIIIGVAVSQK